MGKLILLSGLAYLAWSCRAADWTGFDEGVEMRLKVLDQGEGWAVQLAVRRAGGLRSEERPASVEQPSSPPPAQAPVADGELQEQDR